MRGIYSAANLVAYRRAIEVVYMPRYDSLRQAKLQAKVWYYLMVNDYKEREAEYRNYVATVVKNPGALDLMYQYAYEYLPARAHTKVSNLQIYYEALGNDATAQTEGLFYSLRAVRDANEVKPGLIEGHEMHHQLRPSKDFGPIAADDEGLVEILSSMQNEGIADLVDKSLTMGMPGDPRGIRNWAIDPAPVFIHKMDSTIQARAIGGTPATGRYYRQLSNGSKVICLASLCRALLRATATPSSSLPRPMTRLPSYTSTKKPPRRIKPTRLASRPLPFATSKGWNASTPSRAPLCGLPEVS